MLHHIQHESKLSALKEVFRVLTPGGSLHLLDFQEGKHPKGGHFAFFHHTHIESRFHYMIPHLLQGAGFIESNKVFEQTILLGKIVYYQAKKSI